MTTTSADPGPPRLPAGDSPHRDADDLAASAARAAASFTELHKCLHAQQQSCWADLDLTMSQFKALMLIAATGGLSGRDFARRFGVGPSAVTAVVDKLVQRGYVRREEDPGDRRVSWTRPTPAAMALFEQVNAGHHEQLDEIMALLSPEDVATVERALAILRDASVRWLARSRQDTGACAPAGVCPGIDERGVQQPEASGTTVSAGSHQWCRPSVEPAVLERLDADQRGDEESHRLP